jgi:predicted CXXCH cytochrome family protein
VGAGTKNPNTGEPILCASCHAVHGSNFAYIMPQDETAVCRSCHRTEQ